MRHHPLLSSAATLACLLLALAACGGGGDNHESAACPAFVATDEPSLIITSVQNATTSASIPVVVLSDIQVSGFSYAPELLPLSQGLNVRLVGKTLECTLPCGFSVLTGESVFTVSATGYAPLQVTAKAAYASSYGACPTTLTGGTRIALKLQPA